MTRTVRDVALRTPVTVLPDTSIQQAEQQLIAASAHEIYVTDADERLCGIVADSEFLNYRLLGGDGQGRIAALMSPVSVSLPLSASLDAATRLLKDHHQNSVAIVEGGRLIGQLCRTSLLRILADQGYQPLGDVVAMNPSYLPAPKFSMLSQSAHTPLLMAR